MLFYSNWLECIISHIAFSANDLEGILKHLSELNISLKHHCAGGERGSSDIYC